MRIRSQGGTAIVELAIILPVLILLIFGMVDFAILFYDKAVITNASRVGARVGIHTYSFDANGNPVYCTDNRAVLEATNYVIDLTTQNPILIGFPLPPNPYVQAICTQVQPNGIDGVQVTVTYSHNSLLLPNLMNIGNPFILQSDTVMLKQQ